MITHGITEMKAKKEKIGAIITAIEPNPFKAIPENLETFLMGTGLVIMHGKHDAAVPVKPGFEFVANKSQPTLRAATGDYLSRIRGDIPVGFAKNHILIGKNFSDAYRHAYDNRMERTFAFFSASDQPKSPDLIVVTGSVVEHIYQRVPVNVTLGTDEGMAWLHEFVSTAIMSHRYFDASAMGFVVDPVVEEVAQPAPSKKKK